jgi:isopenicillin-N N-acyltransferase like protein
MGKQHGQQARGLIQAAVPVRWELCRQATKADGTKNSDEEIRLLAQACWEAHAEAVPELLEEVAATAHAAQVDPLGLLIQNGYTDFRDCLYSCKGTAQQPEGCTAFAIGPEAAQNGIPYLGQTWDMHRSALPYVVLLSLKPTNSPPALMISLAGCVGMIGLNAAGLAVCTNNLHARQGQIGLFWPFIMRRLLLCETLAEARSCLLSFPVAGGHNYLLMDASGEWLEVERLPSHTKIRPPIPAQPWSVHTNHCLEDSLIPAERIDNPIGRASSLARLQQADHFLREKSGRITREDLFALTAWDPPEAPHAVCMRPVPEFDMQTCAALVMAPAQGEFWAAWGRPSESAFQSFSLPT